MTKTTWNLDETPPWHLEPATSAAAFGGEQLRSADGWETRSKEYPDGSKVRYRERPIPGLEDVGGVSRVYLDGGDITRDSQPVWPIILRQAA